MATTPTPIPAGETTAAQVTQEVTPQSQPVESQASPQAQDRAAIYERYYGGSQTPASQGPEPSAQDVPSSQEAAPQEPTQPEPPPEPVVEDDRVAKLEQQVSQLVGLLTQIASPQEQQEIAQQATPDASPAEVRDWLDLLREGKKDEAEQALFKKFLGQATQESTTQALELFRVETEINDFVKDLRRENPDLVPFEKFIGYNAQVALEGAISSGKIRNSQDYVQHYKNAVNTAVKEARTMFQQIRAAEKANAQVTKREVLSVSPVPATTQELNRGVPQKPEPPKVETAADYIKMRREQQERRAGLFNS